MYVVGAALQASALVRYLRSTSAELQAAKEVAEKRGSPAMSYKEVKAKFSNAVAPLEQKRHDLKTELALIASGAALGATASILSITLTL
jgi:hypothetical protein